jgi:hypothetical protein
MNVYFHPKISRRDEKIVVTVEKSASGGSTIGTM